MATEWRRLLRFVERINPILIVLILGVSTWAGVTAYHLQQKYHQQDQCFRQVLNSSLAARSEATGLRDDALIGSLVGKDGFRQLLIKIGQKQKVTPQEYSRFLATFDLLVARQDDLEQVKAENPLPKASKSCAPDSGAPPK